MLFRSGVTNATIASIGCGGAVARLPNRNAREDGQYGGAVRWYAENFNETEFGFYFMNYHSRLPLLSGRAPRSSDRRASASGRWLSDRYINWREAASALPCHSSASMRTA